MGPKLGPCWTLFRHKRPSRPTQRASKINPDVQKSPKCVLDPSRSPPDLDFGAPGPPFCSPRPRVGCPQTSIFKRFAVIPLLNYYIVIFLDCAFGRPRVTKRPSLPWRETQALTCFVTLKHCYFETLVLCYFATLLLCSWRGGGVAALLRCWILYHIFV